MLIILFNDKFLSADYVLDPGILGTWDTKMDFKKSLAYYKVYFFFMIHYLALRHALL